MMTFQRVASYVGAEPFRPFRINMVRGKSYDIRHPEMVQVGRNTLTVFTWLSENEDESKERESELSLMLVESIEPLEAASKDK